MKAEPLPSSFGVGPDGGHIVRGLGPPSRVTTSAAGSSPPDFDSASYATNPPADYPATSHPSDGWYPTLLTQSGAVS
nr:hypothetical protein GCM10020063_045080 [Dactylosporangium thailandense]